MSIIIGLTGPTGAGKSTISNRAKLFGFNVIDCDKSARLAVEKGSEGLKAVVNAFGEDILNHDGTLNRKALANKAFADKEHTILLNKTLLPFIAEIIKKQIVTDLTLLDAPTLIESGLDTICDKIVVVLAGEELRKNRIISRDNIDEKAAILRMSAGKDDEFYKPFADYVIVNDGELSALTEKADKIFKSLTERN